MRRPSRYATPILGFALACVGAPATASAATAAP